MQERPQLDLTGVYAKLERAEEHFKVLNSEIDTWLNSGSHSYTITQNDDRTQRCFTLKLIGPEPDLLRWTIIAGDIINNLRCSLDHLVYSIAKYETRNSLTRDIDNLAFIIVDSTAKWDDRNNQNRIAKLSIPVREAIKRVQPYNRLHPHLPPLLAILRGFSNADKHRLLQLAATAVSNAEVEFSTPTHIPTKLGIKTEPIKHGDIFAIMESDSPEPNLTIDSAQFRIEVALWHGLKSGTTDTLQERTAALPLLRLIIDDVKMVVMEIAAVVT